VAALGDDVRERRIEATGDGDLAGDGVVVAGRAAVAHPLERVGRRGVLGAGVAARAVRADERTDVALEHLAAGTLHGAVVTGTGAGPLQGADASSATESRDQGGDLVGAHGVVPRGAWGGGG